MSLAAPHPDVIAAARAGEPERYLAALLAPKEAAADLLAIAAFAAEMRRIPNVVKEPMMGEVRLQWWRDVITGFDTNGVTGHAVADALADTVTRHRLPTAVLIAMTEARAFDLYTDPMPDAAAYAGYVNKTESAVFSLGLQIVKADVPAALADTAGRAFATARLVADLPAWLGKGRYPLPLDLLRETNTPRDDLLQANASAAVRALIAQLCRDIAAAASSVRQQARALPREQRVALLPIATIPAYVSAIGAATRDPLRTVAVVSPFNRVLRIARAHWLGL